MPGVSERVAWVIISDIGVDMTRFPNAGAQLLGIEPVDSRAVAADGVAKLAVIAGSIPTMELTGIGASSVGITAGAMMQCLALLPKVLALLLAIPGRWRPPSSPPGPATR